MKPDPKNPFEYNHETAERIAIEWTDETQHETASHIMLPAWEFRNLCRCYLDAVSEVRARPSR